jgi:hypothetical protein
MNGIEARHLRANPVGFLGQMSESSWESAMRKANNLTIGWIDTNLKALIERDDLPLRKLPVVLLTSVDSTTALSSAEIGRKIVTSYPRCRFLGEGLVVPDGLIFEIGKSFNLFHGFDELWFFDVEPSLQKPKDLWLVAPTNLANENLPSSAGPWMRDTACKIGLGDGIGTSYVAFEEEVAKKIEEGPEQ